MSILVEGDGWGHRIRTEGFLRLTWWAMFARAVQLAQGFTRPLIVSTPLANGTVTSGCAAFVILNDEGWMVTAGHVMCELGAYPQQSAPPLGGADPTPISNASDWSGQDGGPIA